MNLKMRSEERRVGKECRITRWPRDWSSDVCSSDLGESERLIITPYVNSNISDDLFDHVINYSKNNKVLVISSSERRAQRWRPYEIPFSTNDFTLKVNEFKNEIGRASCRERV